MSRLLVVLFSGINLRLECYFSISYSRNVIITGDVLKIKKKTLRKSFVRFAIESFIIIIIIINYEFFTSALADSLSLESELQQVSSGNNAVVLDGLRSSSNFQLF